MSTGELQTTRSDGPSAEVGGWLLLLCFNLTVVYPATSLYAIFVHAVPKLVGIHSPRLTLLLSVYCVVFTAVAIFSFIAGLKLWTVRLDAVRFARRFLWTFVIANIAYFVFWIIVIQPNQRLSFAEMLWYHVVGPIPQMALWYFYLEHSKRVRATYPSG
jgi:Protein of unknown function (DUF2569)